MGNAKMSKCKIAVIPGDGIGKEVVPEGLRVLEAAGAKYGIDFTWETFAWSCEYYAKHGRMMPEDGLQRIRHHDAIFLGAVGFPGVPDHISLWGLLIPIRRQFRQYANLRPVRLMPGVPSPLRDRKPGDIDFYIVRENNEGVAAMSEKYPDVKVDKFHIDILSVHFVLHPQWFDVVVGSNLFGDILSDLGPGVAGTIG